MIQWIKKAIRLVFNSCAVQLQDDIHTTLNYKHEAFRLEARRNQLIDHLLHDTQLGVTQNKYTDHDIIVSVTTYGQRIHEVSLAIESIMQQTMKPNRICLWLDNSFQGQPLPRSLALQQTRGLEIFFCEDIRSYKKLIPQMRQTPKDAIITIDDDILYDYDLLEHLILAYLADPEKIHCCRVHRIKLGKDANILPYRQWDSRFSEPGTSRLLFITGGGGAIYPPNSLDPEVFNQDTFMRICPDADDVWFTAMAIKKGTPINKVFTRNKNGEDYIENPSLGGNRLSYKNVTLDGNDRQINAVFSRYNLMNKLSD
jgi:hypothetical protein